MTNQDEADNTAVDEDSKDRSPCSLCGRKFLSERLEKHLEICQKLKEKKRKQFDSVKQRAENLDKINLVPTDITIASSLAVDSSKQGKKKPNANSKTNSKQANSKPPEQKAKIPAWKAKHEEFLRSIRAARGEDVSTEENNEDNQGDSGSRSKSLPPGMVECPSCGRRFSERAADRHIVWCGEKQQNEHLKRNSNSNPNQEALERMKARTKYKPPTLSSTPATNGPNSSNNTQSRSRSEPKRANQQGDRARVSSNSSRQSEASSTTSTTSNINRKYTRSISKSTESLATKSRTRVKESVPTKRTMTTPSKNTNSGTSSRASTRTDNDHSRLQRETASNRTVVVRKTPCNYASKNVTAKVNTGLMSPKKGTTSPTKMSAPVMKFKEKFPHHQQRINSTLFDCEILRRNSSAYDDSPKTVPGVRTGGISPVKSSNTDKESETNLHKIGGDIKKRIDMYINGLYDNELLNHYADNFNRFVDEHIKGKEHLTEEEIEALKRDAVAEPQMRRPHSINSDLSGLEARGSTSDSTDSGLGVYTNVNAQESIGKNSSNTSTYPVGIVSPPMSELERRSRMMLRNGSLNDIHLLSQEMLIPHHDDQPMMERSSEEPYFEEIDLAAEMTPRFCHSCGTKYPNTLAKFCYECGNRRFVAIS